MSIANPLIEADWRKAMYPQDDVRRHPDGSVDVDFYRRRAARLRAQARHEFLQTKAVPLTKAIVAIVIVATALWLAPGADGLGGNGARPHVSATIANGTVADRS
jgi:hypothetical protein